MIEKYRPEIKDLGVGKYRLLRVGLAAAIVSTIISATACSPLNPGPEGSSDGEGPQSSIPAPCAGAALALSPAECGVEPTPPLTPPVDPIPTAVPSTPAPELPGPSRKPSPSPQPVSVPSELLGTWQGGKADSFYYTFDGQGRYILEHARSGWSEQGTFSVSGQSITFSPAGGNARTSSWEIQEQDPNLDLFGFSFTTLFIDGYSYVK